MNWQVGDVSITLVRQHMASVDAAGMFPGSNAEEIVAANADWLKPHFIDENGMMPLSIHALVVESSGKTIVVDTCLGNRPVAGFDDRRAQLVAPVGERRFGAHPARRHRARRPQDDDRFRLPQLLFDHLVEGLARMQRIVPPHAEAFVGQARGKLARGRPVLAAVGNENIRSRQRSPQQKISISPQVRTTNAVHRGSISAAKGDSNL